MSSSSTVLLPYTLSSVSVARRCIASDLHEDGVFPALIDDVVLVVSELLSNALRHAHPLPSGKIKVSWRRIDDRSIEVAVSDGGSATQPRAGRPGLSSLGGRGLGIVEFIAARWGVRHEEEATTVWAVLPYASSSSNGTTAAEPEIAVLRDCG